MLQLIASVIFILGYSHCCTALLENGSNAIDVKIIAYGVHRDLMGLLNCSVTKRAKAPLGTFQFCFMQVLRGSPSKSKQNHQ